MKIANKIASSLAITALLASCTEMQVPDSEVIPDFRSDTVVPTEIVATFAATKVSYNEIDAGTVFNLRPQWEEGDEIIALDEGGKNYTFTVKTVNEDSATLSGKAPADCQPHLIFCPGISASNLMTVDYTVQTGAQATMPAVMLSDGEVHDGTGNFHFSNAGGIVGISAVKGIPEGTTVTKITVSGENLSTAEIAISGSVLALTATPKTDDAISVEDLNLTVTDTEGTLSSPVLIAVPAGAVIASVSAFFPKEAETMKKPSATPQEGVDYVTIAGIKWAKWNLGASESSEHPETDYGWYFYWGGTEGYFRYADTWQSAKSTSFEFAYSPSSAYTVAASDYVYVKDQTFAIKGHSFNWANTPYHTGGDSSTGWTKYVPSDKASYWWPAGGTPDNKLTLDPDDDAARANWGGNWRMPSTEDISTLKTNTTSEWIEDLGTGINGRLLTSNVAGEEGHSIFIPAAGYGGDNLLKSAGSVGDYWANKVASDPSNACGLFFSNSKHVYPDASQRFHGFPVRPVLE